MCCVAAPGVEVRGGGSAALGVRRRCERMDGGRRMPCDAVVGLGRAGGTAETDREVADSRPECQIVACL
eukprot:scaffold23575_cov65-Phaeocystis_antarctica.AAC.2